MISLVVTDIANYLRAELKEFTLETKNGRKSPKIVEYFFDTKRKVDESDFPCVIVRPYSGKKDSQSDMKINLICGVYSLENEGMMDLVALMDRVMESVMKNYDISPNFKFEKPLEWDISDDQPYPQWLGQITTTWNTPLTQQKFDKEGEIFGTVL